MELICGSVCLQNHVNLVHRKGRTKVCPHPGCGKKFYLSNHLHRHMIIHSGKHTHTLSAYGCVSQNYFSISKCKRFFWERCLRWTLAYTTPRTQNNIRTNLYLHCTFVHQQNEWWFLAEMTWVQLQRCVFLPASLVFIFSISMSYAYNTSQIILIYT